jgi:alkylation response protein AidB-like acyl-CoA dehydrogenase
MHSHKLFLLFRPHLLLTSTIKQQQLLITTRYQFISTTSIATTTATPVCDTQDILFNLFHVLDIENTLCLPNTRFEASTREFVQEALNTAQKISLDKFLPHNRKNDLNEPEFIPTSNNNNNKTSQQQQQRVKMIPEVKEALTAFYDAGFGSLHADHDLGGLQIPSTVTSALMIPFYAGNVGTITFPFLTIAAGNMLRKVGSRDQINRYLKPMLEGKFTGTMNLSETQAGSSLGDITTRAFKRSDGKYDIVGKKMWISGGEHHLSDNIVHMVLAKIADPKDPGKIPVGVKGISLFIVPKKRVDEQGNVGQYNDVELGGLNHKMGWRGATNCVMNYGENRECVGELLGEEGKGLATMFLMMDEARITIGLIAASLGYAGYNASLKYANERRQGRNPENKDPSQPQIFIKQHADVKRMLLQQKCYVEASVALCLYVSRLVDWTHHHHHPLPNMNDPERKEAAILLDVLTPIVKSWPSEWCLEANKWAIQIHGGYGYCRDFTVEQNYRDNRLNMIHEGTNGIQALDLLGRKIKVLNGLDPLLRAIRKTIQQVIKSSSSYSSNDDKNSIQKRAEMLENACVELEKTTKILTSAPPAVMLANAHDYLNVTGFIVMGWIWLQQEFIATSQQQPQQQKTTTSSEIVLSPEFIQGKKITSKYYFKYELPKQLAMLKVLQELDTTCLEVEF